MSNDKHTTGREVTIRLYLTAEELNALEARAVALSTYYAAHNIPIGVSFDSVVLGIALEAIQKQIAHDAAGALARLTDSAKQTTGSRTQHGGIPNE